MPWPGEQLLEQARRAWSRTTEPSTPIVAEDVNSSVSVEECLLLAELARGRRVLEIGSYLGRSTIAMASTATVVHSVDLHPPDDDGLGSTVGTFVENLDRYGVRHKVVAHLGFSQLILPELRSASFDLVFLDAQHQREPVEEDLRAILPLMCPDSILAFHDYGLAGVEHQGRWDPFGVTEVVDALAAARGVPVEVVGTVAVVRLSGA